MDGGGAGGRFGFSCYHSRLFWHRCAASTCDEECGGTLYRHQQPLHHRPNHSSQNGGAVQPQACLPCTTILTGHMVNTNPRHQLSRRCTRPCCLSWAPGPSCPSTCCTASPSPQRGWRGRATRAACLLPDCQSCQCNPNACLSLITSDSDLLCVTQCYCESKGLSHLQRAPLVRRCVSTQTSQRQVGRLHRPRGRHRAARAGGVLPRHHAGLLAGRGDGARRPGGRRHDAGVWRARAVCRGRGRDAGWLGRCGSRQAAD